MAKDYIIERLKVEFSNRESFSRDELFSFFRHYEPDLKETTFRWRIYQLKEKKLIRSISRHEFTLSYKPIYKPIIEDNEKRIYSKLEKQFQDLKLCVWSTNILHEFMLHQHVRDLTIIEVEKEAIEPVFNYLKDINYNNVYFQPEEKEIERYIYESNNALVVKSLISKAPLQTAKKVKTVTIEKLIVDLFSDRKLFNAFQGSELAHMINNAYRHYAIDFTKLLSYAGRRKKETELIEFLSNSTDIPQNILND